MKKELIDSYGRKIEYLRISVTDRCNFKCGYCYKDNKMLPKEEILSLEEIARVAEIAVEMGFKSIKLTGGEPLLRKNIEDLVSKLSRLDLDDLSLTTNGYFLKEKASMLKDAGLKRVTVSIDSLEKDSFKKIIGCNYYEEVFGGIEKAIDVFGKVKLNTVLIKNYNEEQVDDFLKMAFSKPINLRFIELIPNNGYRPIETTYLKNKIKSKLDLGGKVNSGMGPSENYEIKGGIGTIGFISLKEQKFCDKCNRLRVKVNGKVKPCLYNSKEFSFIDELRGGDDDGVREAFLKAIREKPRKHGELVTEMRKNGG